MKITDNIKQKSKERIFTDNEKLLKDKTYNACLEIIHSLKNTGTLNRTPGFCLSISDMMIKLLSINGIECHLQECSLTIRTKNPPGLSLIGHDGAFKNVFQDKNKESLDSHIVVVTDTEIPILIDLSVSVYDKNIPYICEELKSNDQTTLAYYNFDDSEWFYNLKPYSSLPRLHQQSIIKRIEMDKEIFTKIKNINKILLLVVLITSLNLVRGGYDFYAKYINQTNGFGPHKAHK